MLASECCFEQNEQKGLRTEENKRLNYVRAFKENCAVIYMSIYL